jgi:hypothetical protein
MLKSIELYGFALLLSCSVSHAMLLVDVPEDGEHQKTINCLKKNTFPNVGIKDGELDQESIVALTDHFSSFSNGTFLNTPESTFLQSQLQKEGLNYPVIHVPQTIYDLEVIYRFLSDKNFADIAKDNSKQGLSNNLGIKDCNIVDRQFLQLSKELFPIFSQFQTEEDFLNYATKQINNITSIENPTDRSMLYNIQQILWLKDSQALIRANILHELQSQKEGKINFYRATNGLVYDKDPERDEKTLSQHPKIMAKYEDNVACLKSFFCGTNCGLQKRRPGKYPILSENATLEEILTLQKTSDLGDERWQKILTDMANEVSGAGKIIDYPFENDPSEANGPQAKKPKDLSYSYSLLGGFIFDGICAQQSACGKLSLFLCPQLQSS